MNIEIVPANTATEGAALTALDMRIFLPSDCFDRPDVWKEYLAFWIIVDDDTVGSIALGLNLEFSNSCEFDKPSLGCVYLASIGMLPEFRYKGIGNFVMRWVIAWATHHRFLRISSHCRKSNEASLRLHTKFGFKVTREVPGYYTEPDEATIVMDRLL